MMKQNWKTMKTAFSAQPYDGAHFQSIVVALRGKNVSIAFFSLSEP